MSINVTRGEKNEYLSFSFLFQISGNLAHLKVVKESRVSLRNLRKAVLPGI